jgi:hypothetical protein
MKQKPRGFPLTRVQKVLARKAAQDGLTLEQIATAIDYQWGLDALGVLLRQLRIKPRSHLYLRGEAKKPTDRSTVSPNNPALQPETMAGDRE